MMRNATLITLGVLLAAGCGVNPDRLATAKERAAQFTEQGDEGAGGAESDGPMVEYSDQDPEDVRNAVLAYQDLAKLAQAKEYARYLTKRYDLLKTVSFEANETLATSDKTPKILSAIRKLDSDVASAAGARAQEVVGADSRVDIASADAIYALSEGFDACRAALVASDQAMMEEHWGNYDAALLRAKGVDAKSWSFVGKHVNGTSYLDVPAEIAVCEAQYAVRKLEAEDAPGAPEDLARDFTGCGFYAVNVEAKQTAPNQFGDYLITSAFAMDADPGAATQIECPKIPPVSDAPGPVQKVVKEFVTWLQPSDVLSMAGPFEYAQAGPDLFKRGTARVYRRQAALKTNKCGSETADLTCEAEGSALATAHNHAAHYIARAGVHKAAGNAERCRKMGEAAAKAAGATSAETADMSFLLADGSRLSHAELTTRVGELKTQAQQMAEGDWAWCAQQ